MTKAISVQCTAISEQTGKQCKAKAIPGGTVCRWHGGAAGQVKAKAAVRAEVLNWGLGDSHVDPGEVLLRLATQSAARAEMYARLLQEAFDAAERLKHAHDSCDRCGSRLGAAFLTASSTADSSCGHIAAKSASTCSLGMGLSRFALMS